MKKLLAITFLLNLFGFNVAASGGNETQGARSQSLGGASSTLIDAWSATNNVGGIGLMSNYSVAVGYETRFFLPEAGLSSLSFVAPLGGGSIGLIGHNYGYAGFANTRIGLSYGRVLSKYFALGVGLNYVQTRMGDVYGSRSNVVGEIGMVVTPAEKVRLAATLYNPTRSKLADFDDERIPTSLRIGGQYKFSEKVFAVVELDKDTDLPINIKSGIEYSPVEAFNIRLGFATLQSSLGFGIGYSWNKLEANVSANWNQSLGYSTAISLGFGFGERKKVE